MHFDMKRCTFSIDRCTCIDANWCGSAPVLTTLFSYFCYLLDVSICILNVYSDSMILYCVSLLGRVSGCAKGKGGSMHMYGGKLLWWKWNRRSSGKIHYRLQ